MALTSAGLRMVSRVCQRGVRWSAPRCGSWVAAPLSVTILVGIHVVNLLLFEAFFFVEAHAFDCIEILTPEEEAPADLGR